MAATRVKPYKEYASFDEWTIHNGAITDASGRHPVIRFSDIYFLQPPANSPKQHGTHFYWLITKDLKRFFKNLARHMYRHAICQPDKPAPSFNDCFRVAHYHVDLDKEYIHIPFGETYQGIKKINIKHPYTFDMELKGLEWKQGQLVQYQWRLIQIILQDQPLEKCMIQKMPDHALEEVWSPVDSDSDEEPAAVDIVELSHYACEQLERVDRALEDAWQRLVVSNMDKINAYKKRAEEHRDNVGRAVNFATLKAQIEGIETLVEESASI